MQEPHSLPLEHPQGEDGEEEEEEVDEKVEAVHQVGLCLGKVSMYFHLEISGRGGRNRTFGNHELLTSSLTLASTPDEKSRVAMTFVIAPILSPFSFVLLPYWAHLITFQQHPRNFHSSQTGTIRCYL